MAWRAAGLAGPLEVKVEGKVEVAAASRSAAEPGPARVSIAGRVAEPSRAQPPRSGPVRNTGYL